MFELRFHKKIIAEVDRVGVQGLELLTPGGAGVHEQPLGRFRARKFVQPFDKKENRNPGQDEHGQRRGQDRRMPRRL